jgi:DNA-binding response OmpR family regulator
MLTAKSMLEDKLNGFDNGANDYLTKPFHIDELIARVNVQLKNSTDLKKKDVIEYGDLELDISSSKLTCIKTNNSVELVCKEFQLLEYFMNNPKQILSKEQLYDKIWGINNEIESNNLEVYLSFVRKKLKAIESNVNIKSSRGLGYKMEYDNE